jgi:RNA polymerase sigma-70 factor (ECF subfamily)
VLWKEGVAAVSANLNQEQKFSALMRSAQLGDRNAYAQLLRALVPLTREIVRHRYNFLRSPDIDELVKDILLSVHVARATYDPSRPFLPWVMAIALNRIADNARRYARRAAHEVASEPHPEAISADEVNLSRKEYGDTRALAKAMSNLRRKRRMLIMTGAQSRVCVMFVVLDAVYAVIEAFGDPSETARSGFIDSACGVE